MSKDIRKIEYSIVSKGTERDDSSKGYMAVSYAKNNKRKIIPIPHGTREALCDEKCLDVNEKVSIEKIAFSRFQLISSLMYLKNKQLFDKNEEILVLGAGSIGYTACMELARQSHKKISLLSRREVNTQIFKEAYGISIKLVKNIKQLSQYQYIVDATGNSNILKEIIELCNPFTTIFILGTPRINPEISSLIIHRKNIRLIGTHEIIGLTNKERNTTFQKIIKENIKYPDSLFSELAVIEDYSTKKRGNTLNEKNKIINILRY